MDGQARSSQTDKKNSGLVCVACSLSNSKCPWFDDTKWYYMHKWTGVATCFRNTDRLLVAWLYANTWFVPLVHTHGNRSGWQFQPIPVKCCQPKSKIGLEKKMHWSTNTWEGGTKARLYLVCGCFSFHFKGPGGNRTRENQTLPSRNCPVVHDPLKIAKRTP